MFAKKKKILYVENPEDSQKIETANRWVQQSARYNINIQKKSVPFLYTSNEQSKKETMKTVSSIKHHQKG